MKPTDARIAPRGARARRGAAGRAAFLLLAVAGAACTAEWDAGRGGEPVSVFAASSLVEAFTEMEAAFEAAHPELDVVLAFAGSQVLRLQIEQGARADVFASADEGHVEALVDEGLVHDARTLAFNRLVVVVPASGTSPVETFEDLPRAERLVIGTPAVPAGAYARELLDRAGSRFGPDFAERVMARVVSEESNVRLVRAKVEMGEADAAIVYRTDARASTGVRAVEPPGDLAVRARYAIARVEGAGEGADLFIDFTRSDEGQAILERHGFDGAGT